MVLPVNVDTATVEGSFVKLDGTPCAGTVTFTPVPARLLDADADPPTTIIGTPIVATLDEFGAVTLELPATDDADLNPLDWGYHVSVRLGDYAAYSFCMTAAAGTTVDLAVVTPIYTADGDAIVAGPAGAAGPAGEGVPEGGDTADVLAKASSDDYDTVWVPASAPGAHASTHTAGSSDPVTITEAQVTGLVADLAAKQPLDADLTAIAALAPGSDAVIQRKVGMWVASTPTEYKADLDLTSADVGLGNVTNTSDANKPVSTAQAPALALKADKTAIDGGTTGQVLSKVSNTDFDTAWITAAGGGDVSSTRTISTTAPLTGGGDLSANRTLAITAFAGSTPGSVPTSAGGETSFLRADGTWAVPSGGGAISSHVTFSYNNTTSEPPTGNQIRMNSTTQTAVTRLWISQTTVDGLDVSLGLARIAAGHQIYIQDRDDAAKWVKYTVSAAGTDDGTYYDFTVVYHSGPADVPTGQVELQSLAPPADGFSAEDAVDAVGAALVEGAGIDIVYDDGANTITVATTGVQAINAQTGTTYTLLLADAAKLVTLSNASAITLTVPLNSSVAYPVGTSIDLAQLSAGKVTVAATGGVTLNAASSTKAFRTQYSAATLTKYATDTWLLVGDLET